MQRQARCVAAIPLCTFLSLWLSSRTSTINHTVTVGIPYFSGSLHTAGACQIHLSASINTHASVQPQAASLPKLKALANPLRNRRGGQAVRPRNQNHCHPQHWRDCSALCAKFPTVLRMFFPFSRCEEPVVPVIKRVCFVSTR